VYVNYALFDTPLEYMYGGNVPKLREINAEIDPEDMMGLAGGSNFDMIATVYHAVHILRHIYL